jgi:formylglycine-generating enzyme required for sulfatase activity
MLPGLKSVEERLEFARTLENRTVQDPNAAWAAAIARIAGNPKYCGLRLVPQIGLIPLGPDPRSGLEEFHETQTGESPVRDGEGTLQIGERTALVFVLLPGGRFTMGAQDKDPLGQNYDPQAQPFEMPPNDVTLAPFFLSKYEMTQGQWLRFTGSNPSFYQPDGGWGTDLRCPVEQVTWDDCKLVMARLALRLPTEAQWEYACRAGTTTAWNTGNDVLSLAGFANIADEGSKSAYGPGWNHEIGLRDGFPFTAPVGSMRPNGFGLHDMHGNVWERCEDGFGWYALLRPEPGDGLRVVAAARTRESRGGSFQTPSLYARSAFRSASRPSLHTTNCGLRPARRVEP